MKRVVGTLSHSAASLWHDTSGLMLPYVTVMLTVLVGLSLLALDGARYMSLQTQMQAAADALALAGARELNQQSGAQTRAISAMANAYKSGSAPNTLSGMGTSPNLMYTYTFYRSLPAATAGLTGVAATGDSDSKYLRVTVAPVRVPTIFPVGLLRAGGADNFSVGADAVAGFQGITVCAVTPIFICNPYEAAGMTDQQATEALYAAYDNQATLRQQLRMDRTRASPGHFGWVQTADGCNNTNCMSANIAAVNGACYNSYNVALATGNKTSVEQYFNTKFDMYSQSPTVPITATNAPAINVRKGYVPGNTGNTPDWCHASPANPYYTTPIVPKNITGNTYNNFNIITVSNTSDLSVGSTITGNSIPLGTKISRINTSNKTITISANSVSTQTGEILTITRAPLTSGFPLDKQFNGDCESSSCVLGSGDWDCADYWTINHPTASPPAGCRTSGTTISRYQVYRYEITNGLINDWSANLSDAPGVKNPPGTFQTENGAPYCAASNGVRGVDITTGGPDPRNLIVPVINCLAQTALGNIADGNTVSNVPVAAFGRYFITQPFGADGTPYLYGEMTGAVTSNDNVTIMHQVQLYR
jgi:Flp pilus assembly protein TadG